MGTPLRVLVIEDSENDGLLLIRELRRGGYDPTYERVETANAMAAALQDNHWDIMIADYSMPHFSGPEALQIVKAHIHDIPVIMVSGTMGEDIAAATMVAGASDYIMKGNLQRLVPAVKRELREAQERRARRQAEIGLRKSEERFRRMADTIPDGLTIIENDKIVYVNDRACEIFGYPGPELMTLTTFDVAAPEEHARLRRIHDEHRATGTYPSEVEFWIVRPDGTRRCIQNRYSTGRVRDGITEHFVITTDITGRTIAEQTSVQRQRELESLLKTSRDLSSLLDLDKLLGMIARRAISLLAANECTLFRLYDDQAILRPVLYVGQHTEKIMALELRVGQGVTGTCVAKNQPILANFALHDPRAMQVNGTPEEANEHIMAAPLVFHEQVIGAMLVSRYTGQPFTENELSLFVGFAQQATIAFKNAQLFQKLELYTSDLERLVAERTAELLQSKERVETILRNSPEAILLLGKDGTIETVNPAFSKMFGYSSPEITEQSPVELIAPDYAEAFSDALHTVLTGGQTGRVRVLVQRKDGMRFDADAALAPVVEDGAVTGLVCGIHDISAFKEVERLKDEFVSNVTHELRTPITSIRLYHDLLVRNPVKSDVYMDRLARETSRLERIIDDLLYLSRLDQGRVVFKPQLMDLNRLARQYVTDRTPLADSRSLTLILVEASDVLPIQADEGLIGQALSILLTNALNYTPPGGSVTIYTLAREVEGQQWAGIRVSDTGPGIPPDEQPRLFKRFFRGQAGRESNTPGTGLGLALLHDIVQRHHGQVEVFSDGIPGQGTTFTIWLPVSPPPSLPEAPPPA